MQHIAWFCHYAPTHLHSCMKDKALKGKVSFFPSCIFTNPKIIVGLMGTLTPPFFSPFAFLNNNRQKPSTTWNLCPFLFYLSLFLRISSKLQFRVEELTTELERNVNRIYIWHLDLHPHRRLEQNLYDSSRPICKKKLHAIAQFWVTLAAIYQWK